MFRLVWTLCVLENMCFGRTNVTIYILLFSDGKKHSNAQEWASVCVTVVATELLDRFWRNFASRFMGAKNRSSSLLIKISLAISKLRQSTYFERKIVFKNQTNTVKVHTAYTFLVFLFIQKISKWQLFKNTNLSNVSNRKSYSVKSVSMFYKRFLSP